MAVSRFTNQSVKGESVLVNPTGRLLVACGWGLQLKMYPYELGDERRACIRGGLDERCAILMKQNCKDLVILPPVRGELLDALAKNKLAELTPRLPAKDSVARAEAFAEAQRKAFIAAWTEVTGLKPEQQATVDRAAVERKRLVAMLEDAHHITADDRWSVAKIRAVMENPMLAFTGPDDLGEQLEAEEDKARLKLAELYRSNRTALPKDGATGTEG